MIERMKELVNLLSHANYLYEQENKEIMSNREYDALYDELVQLEKQTGIILSGSVTQNVGHEIASSLPKVTHAKPMLSLDKTKEIAKLKSFLQDNEGLLSWKMDGLTIVCTYENGKLIRAVTRGNGRTGEEITNNAYAFKNLPITIDYKESLILRGEAVITYKDFEKINETLEENEKYKNPRNLCSGSVRQLNPQITAKRHVRCYLFTLVSGGPSFKEKSQALEWLKERGFEVVEYQKVTQETIEEAVQTFKNCITSQPIASDGLVLTYNDIAYSESLGETSKFPKDSIAFKWQDELVQTELLKMEWNTSRTGLINPIAIFKPVEIEGTTVERASVHNLSILEALQLGIGDKILVYKANLIIPQIAENLTKSHTVEIPEYCPVCGAKTEIKAHYDTKTLICPNENCKAQRVHAFVHYTSRDAMNIEGLSEATIEKFLEKGYLEDFNSLYHLEQYKEAILNMEGFGEKSYTNLIASIEKSREVYLAQFLYALGIAQVGLSTARLLCRQYDDSLETLIEASEEDLVAIDGIGPIIAKEFVNYFKLQENRQMVLRLVQNELDLKKEEKMIKNKQIDGKTFVITGEVHHFKNRKALQAQLEALGGKVTGSVSKKTDYLINNDSTSTSSKNQKAQALNIPIINEEKILSWIQKEGF